MHIYKHLHLYGALKFEKETLLKILLREELKCRHILSLPLKYAMFPLEN